MAPFVHTLGYGQPRATDDEILVLMGTMIVDALAVTKYFYRFARASTGPDRSEPKLHLPCK